MKYLVTGGAGFIGSHIVEELVKKGEEVVVIDNLFTGKLDNIRPFLSKVKFVKADIRDFDTIKNEFKGIDFVLHQAALRSVPASLKDPIAYNEVNINGLFNVLEASRINDVKKVVFASSSSVYGDAEKLPLKESFLPKPISPYAITKLAGEHYMNFFYKAYGLKTLSLRYFNVFGPRQDPNSEYSAVIPLFIKAVASGKSPIIFGDGSQSRDFTFVKNNVYANLLACEKENATGVFNIAAGKTVTVNELLEKINQLLGKSIKGNYTAERKGDVKHTLASTTKAKKNLGFKVTASFDKGLKETVNWFKGSLVI